VDSAGLLRYPASCRSLTFATEHVKINHPQPNPFRTI
jgi:hypothetical protein